MPFASRIVMRRFFQHVHIVIRAVRVRSWLTQSNRLETLDTRQSFEVLRFVFGHLCGIRHENAQKIALLQG